MRQEKFSFLQRIQQTSISAFSYIITETAKIDYPINDSMTRSRVASRHLTAIMAHRAWCVCGVLIVTITSTCLLATSTQNGVAFIAVRLHHQMYDYSVPLTAVQL